MKASHSLQMPLALACDAVGTQAGFEDAAKRRVCVSHRCLFANIRNRGLGAGTDLRFVAACFCSFVLPAGSGLCEQLCSGRELRFRMEGSRVLESSWPFRAESYHR